MTTMQSDTTKFKPGRGNASTFSLSEHGVGKDEAGAIAESILASRGKTGFTCGRLFDFSPTLFGLDGENATACMCRSGETVRLAFVVTNVGSRVIQLVEEAEAPDGLVALAWSYARVLAHLPSIRARGGAVTTGTA